MIGTLEEVGEVFRLQDLHHLVLGIVEAVRCHLPRLGTDPFDNLLLELCLKMKRLAGVWGDVTSVDLD